MHQLRTSFSLALLLAVPVSLPAQSDASSGAVAAEAAAPSSPKAQMKAINQSMKKILAFLKTPEGDAPVAQAIAAQHAALEAKILIPSLAAEQPEDQRDAFLKGYRKQINALMRNLLDLEDALEAGDWTAAGEAAAKCGQAKKDGHGKFKGRSRRGR